MLLLILFAFLGGIVTILSPCILAVLPIILSGTTGGKRRPLGVVVGFVSGFTFFTLFLTTIVNAFGIAADTLRYVAIVVLLFFGLAMTIPWVLAKIEIIFSRVASRTPDQAKRQGFGGGILIGLSLGLLWTPCVGPILASVISLALTGSVTGSAAVIAFAYALGTALPMLAIMWGGQRLMKRVSWLKRNAGRIQQAFGVLMIITAVAIVFNADKKIQAYVTERLPDYASTLTGFEDNEAIQEELDKLEGRDRGGQSRGNGKESEARGDAPLAPELIPGGEWLNSEPLTMEKLKGEVVLVDFVTYSCINCIRTFPYLNAWHDKYSDMGLTIVGVHTPEFEFEKDADNVRQALSDHGIEFPVMQDNDYATWRAYGNRYWPRKYLIDHRGRIVYDHIGEGAYEETETKIQELLAERGRALSRGQEALPGTVSSNISGESREARSKEVYFGAARNQYLGNGEAGKTGEFDFTLPENIEDDRLYLSGRWRLTDEYARPLETGAKAVFRYNARRVFLVAGAEEAGSLNVRQDNGEVQSRAGSDLANGRVNIVEERLYRLIDNGEPGRHLLELDVLAPGLELFTFTFG